MDNTIAMNDTNKVEETVKKVSKALLIGAAVVGAYKIGKFVGISKTCVLIGNGIYKTAETVKLPDGRIVDVNVFMDELLKTMKQFGA